MSNFCLIYHALKRDIYLHYTRRAAGALGAPRSPAEERKNVLKTSCKPLLNRAAGKRLYAFRCVCGRTTVLEMCARPRRSLCTAFCTARGNNYTPENQIALQGILEALWTIPPFLRFRSTFPDVRRCPASPVLPFLPTSARPDPKPLCAQPDAL